MSKEKKTTSSCLQSYVTEFRTGILSTDNNILFYKVCNMKVSSEKRFSVTQHIATEKHRKAVKRIEEKKDKSQQFLLQNSMTKSSFKSDLCRAMLSANIPFNKLNNPHFKNFLEKCLSEVIPDQSKLQKSYVDSCYQETVREIRNKVAEKKI
jgi:hypothetical protein